MSSLQAFDLFLCFWRDHALPVQLAIRTRVRLIAGRQQIRGYIAYARYVSDNPNLFFHFRQLCEKIGLCIAFDNLFGNGITRFKRFFKTIGIGLVEKDLSL